MPANPMARRPPDPWAVRLDARARALVLRMEWAGERVRAMQIGFKNSAARLPILLRRHSEAVLRQEPTFGHFNMHHLQTSRVHKWQSRLAQARNLLYRARLDYSYFCQGNA